MEREQIIETFKSEFDKFRTEPFKSSLDYYITTGDVSGNLLLTLVEFADAILALQPEQKDNVFDIDCAGHVLMQVSIKYNIPVVLQAINGYGNRIEIKDIIVNPVNQKS